jgi:polyisoprenoid-binding protein YceI
MSNNIIKTLFLVAAIMASQPICAQRYMTKTAAIDFISKTPIETFTALNKSGACLFDAATGSLDLIVQIKSFVFEKQLMQEHFNENYLESEKFPKATFKGKVKTLSAAQLAKDGTYPVEIEGKLTMHGVTKDINEKARIIVNNKGIILDGQFNVAPTDYQIAIPGAVKDKIAKEVSIHVKANMEPFTK